MVDRKIMEQETKHTQEPKTFAQQVKAMRDKADSGLPLGATQCHFSPDGKHVRGGFRFVCIYCGG